MGDENHQTENVGAMMLGYWGESTATLDWCETNYDVTYYMAEFWNTVSNYIYLLPPSVAIYYAIKYRLEVRFVMSFVSIIAIGIGSWFFHMTLRYTMQLFDELSMLYASAVILYILYECETDAWQTNYTFVALLLFLTTTITIVYVVIKVPVFHQVCYGLMAGMIMYKGFRLRRSHGDRIGNYIFSISLICYVVAVTLWSIDNLYCDNIRSFRLAISSLSPLISPLGVVSQFHAWWHIFTGVSTYLFILFVIRIRLRILQKDCSLQLYQRVIPYVVVHNKSDVNGSINPMLSYMKTYP